MLPKTTKQHYITGMTALNIPSEAGTGDWHFQESFHGRGKIKPKIVLAGKGETLNTNPLLFEFGIYECSDILRKCGITLAENEKVYAANHYRAVLDMLYRCVHQQSFPHHLDIHDWFNKQDEITVLITEIKRLKEKLSDKENQIIDRWLTQQI